jgi:hypothetical protein
LAEAVLPDLTIVSVGISAREPLSFGPARRHQVPPWDPDDRAMRIAIETGRGTFSIFGRTIVVRRLATNLDPYN